MSKIYLDTGKLDEIKEWINNPIVEGLTTNPTLMAKSGVKDYEEFAKEVLSLTDKPVSFEVFADEFDDMERQARIISSWGENIYVKIPITNTKGEPSWPLIEKLNRDIKINVTAVFTQQQIYQVASVLIHQPSIISIFSGRIMDTGRNPNIQFRYARGATAGRPVELLWASPRSVWDIYQSNTVPCDMITVTPQVLQKYLNLKDKSLDEYSVETVQMFYNDGKEAGYDI